MSNSPRKQRSFFIKMLIVIVLTVVSFVMAMTFGAAETTIEEVWQAILHTGQNETVIMLQEIRLPRVIGAIFVGAALAVAGAVMQGMTRNALADPGLIGLTAGASAAMALTIALLPTVNYFGIMIACFIGAALGALLVFGIGASRQGNFSSFRIVLAGAAISTFLHAIAEGTGIYFKISKDVSMWTAGGLIGTTWGQLQIIIPVIIIGLIFAVILSKQLTILSLSEEVAVGLGQKTFLIKGLLFVVVVVLAGAAVSLVGNIVFIGLMIPHIVRAITGTDYRFIIPMTVFVGASFMLLADTVARTVNAPYETPVAAIVALLGLPFFLYIIRKGGRGLT